MTELTIIQKVRWLQKNYKNYSDEWYLKDLSRLNAIYTREKSLEHIFQMCNVRREQEEEFIKKDGELTEKYFNKYNTKYYDDLKIDKRLVMERVRNL